MKVTHTLQTLKKIKNIDFEIIKNINRQKIDIHLNKKYGQFELIVQYIFFYYFHSQRIHINKTTMYFYFLYKLVIYKKKYTKKRQSYSKN